MASDVTGAHCAVLGTREHALSLLAGVAAVIAVEANELAVNGGGADALLMTLLGEDVLGTFDTIVGVA